MSTQRLTETELYALLDNDETPEELVADYFELDEKTLPTGLNEAEIAGIADIPNLSTADQGLVGRFNRWSRRKRQKKFRRRAEGFQGLTIVAEGDSWWQYPVKLKDVIDHLFDDDDVNIYSLGFAGDWLANMLVQKEYLAPWIGSSRRSS